ncbi:SdpI family protein [Nocardioides jensenii]|uniref:SdpI family protein n=1 Tax=Nocardioides jensenii TaxID=1843 RepID=UPI000835073A|nr:SdpI family protein [Nocardioides jensenii]
MSEFAAAKVMLATVLAASGVVLVWVARATATGRLGRNPWAGIRTRATSASDDAWLTAHRAAQRPSEASGWCLVAAGVVAVLAPSSPILIGAALVGVTSTLALTLYGARVGMRAVR